TTLFRSERATAEENIRSREQQLRLVTDAMPVLIAYCDADAVYRFCNVEYFNWFGLERDNVIGQHVSEVIGPAAYERVEPYIQRALSGERVTVEQMLDYRHGPRRNVRIEYVPHETDWGVVGYYAMIEDISERVASDLERARLAAIVEHTDDAVYSKDLEGRINSWNKGAERMYGYTTEEAIGQHVSFIVPESESDALDEIFKKLEAGEATSYETFRQQKNGQLREVSLTVSPIRDTSGRVIGGSAIARDIAARREMERQLGIFESRLAVAKQAAELGLFNYEIETGELDWDERLREIWGLTSEEPATYEKFMEGLHEDDRNVTQAAVNQALDPAGDGHFYAEYRVVNRDSGDITWIAATGQVIFEDGAPLHMIGIVQDITERMRTEQQLKEWSEFLEERVAERTAIADRRAEDLRALATQLTNAEQRARTRLARSIHDDLQQLLVAAKMRVPTDGRVTSGEELSALRELLDEALAHTRALVSEISPPVLRDGTLADALGWLARHMKDRHGLEVAVSEAPEMPLTDKIKIVVFESVRELLFNVVKHADTEAATIDVSADDEAFTIVVTDKGAGFMIDPANRSSEGFGLLSVQERVGAFGGTIDVASTPGEGTRVTMSFPSSKIGRSSPVESPFASSTRLKS
ncbi:MAG: PAS domain S-box protein, partial [Phycisphaerales bacterium]